MSNSLFFSIIMPVYNTERFIDRAINSVLNQSFQSFELIIINDFSSDNSSLVIQKYKDDNRIKIINHTENLSVHMARYSGVNISQGKWSIFLDSDDFLAENALEEIAMLISQKTFDVCEFGYKKIPKNKIYTPVKLSSEISRFEYFFSAEEPIQTMWNKVYKTEILKKAFDSMQKIYMNNLEDLYESIVISYFTKSFYTTDTPVINYSVGTGMSTQQQTFEKNKKFCSNYLSMKKSLILFLENNNINDIDLKMRHIDNYVIKLFYGIVSGSKKEDRAKSFLLLFNSFDYELLIPYFNNFYKQYRKYELGLFSFRNFIKSFFKCVKKVLKLFPPQSIRDNKL